MVPVLCAGKAIGPILASTICVHLRPEIGTQSHLCLTAAVLSMDLRRRADVGVAADSVGHGCRRGGCAFMDWSTEEGTYVGDERDVVEYSVRTPIARRFLKVDPSGRAYYVSPNGDDGNPGTMEAPFRTIQRCADIAQAGDTCFVREGTYRETVRPKHGGRVRDPIRYVAYPGEKVILNGTDVVRGEWTAYRGRDLPDEGQRDL